MDPSALIFVALAVAWCAYLLPTAMKHRDEVQRTRSVERFSHRMRVLARRVPTSSRDARLVVTPNRPKSRPVVETKPAPRPADRVNSPVSSPIPSPEASPTMVAARRKAAAAATRRRRNVLSVILLGLVVVTGLSLGGLFSPWWITAPGAVLVAWLVACRVMVKSENRATDRLLGPARTSQARRDTRNEETVAMAAVGGDPLPADPADAEETPADDDPSRWDMVPVTLPTYVSKPAAQRRTVQTIDLESTGVWTSGRTEIDAALARAADEERKSTGAAKTESERRATGT